MALTNIINEPRRELTGSVVGIAVASVTMTFTPTENSAWWAMAQIEWAIRARAIKEAGGTLTPLQQLWCETFEDCGAEGFDLGVEPKP